MTYKITLMTSGVPTEIETQATEASVKTITEGLDAHEVSVTWRLEDIREDPNYEVIRYVWPGALVRLQLRRESDDVLVFDGQVHAVAANREEHTFTLTAQS